MSIENNHDELHAKLGASNAHRWRNCRRSPLFIDELRRAGTIPMRDVNKFAAEGTVAHTWAEQFLRCELSGNDGADVQAVYPFGERVEEDGFQFTTDQPMFDAIMQYVAYVTERMQIGVKVSLEKRVQIPEQMFRDPRPNLNLTGALWGTTDCEIIKPYHFYEIVDYKHGAGKLVRASNNDQGKFYLAAGYFSLPEWLRSEIRTLRFTIIQPRHRDSDGPDSVEYTPEEVAQAAVELIEDAAQVTEDAALTAGPWCEWCPAIKHCPAHKTNQVATMGADMAKADAFEQRNIIAPVNLTPPQLIAIVENKGMVLDYIEQVEELVKSQLQAGTAPPEIAERYTLKTNYTNYAWVNETQCGEVLQAQLGAAAFTAPKLKSYSQIRDLLAAKEKQTGVKFEGLDKMASRQVSSYSLKKAAEVPVNQRAVSVKNMLEQVDKCEVK